MGPPTGQARRDAGTTVPPVTELDPDLVVQADTDIGPLWVERRATILTESLLELGHWDPALSGLMRKALEPGMTFVDVGANIGYLTILGAKLVGSEGRAFAIEPDPINLSILAANLEKHGCSNVTVLPVAAWSERTQLTLTRPPDEGAAAQVGHPEEDGDQVPAAPLDDLIAGPVNYIKIDCEQTDHVVVRGAERLIRESPATLVTVEFLPEHASHTGDSPSEILDQYERMGLSPFWISHPKPGLRPTRYQQIADAPLPDGAVSFDFAMSRTSPDHLLVGKGLLERAGDMLEHVPEPLRPRIRHRDRVASRRSS
jgi:FkbM family methyltransferase